MARAGSVDLSVDDAFERAAARVIEARGVELVDLAEGVLNTGDIERVHDMRVATRRLRAALEVFEACFPRKPYKAVLREVKVIADGLGERRDRDVAIDALERFSAQMHGSGRPGVQSLIDSLAGEQTEANTALEPLVAPERMKALSAAIAQLVTATGAGAPPAE